MYDVNMNPPWLSSYILTLSQFNTINSFPRGDVYFFVLYKATQKETSRSMKVLTGMSANECVLMIADGFLFDFGAIVRFKAL